MKKLDVNSLAGFKPKTDKNTEDVNRRKDAPISGQESWPSREPESEGQFTIRASKATSSRFKKICKDDRRTYGAMLEILMDTSEPYLDIKG